jgi:hypothetical protein
MTGRWFGCAALVAIALVLGGADTQPVAEPADNLAVIVHADNPVRVTAGELESVFLRHELEWPDGDPVIPVNATPDSARRKQFDRVVLGMSPDEVARYWLDQRIRGAGTAPREIGDAFLTLRLVARIKGAIGYVPEGSELRDVRVVARIRDGKLVLR